ncbi:uncharacterized protein AMSG_05247 [Thecamonas trahens ATCC 50062]|uniref:Uncharacterized protein n=1 Tax=Thecamonas trahens ATCC 50062 TaxID=461836 RepID=A0A0L0DA83_THETB|nr:hypothetical protein AMSG_05247 [Thecamonas trahens ATCC 50062]KNC49252.1 hypothetical protein AMSG_05247 [Thecamonas trahens ATCC 50062]|eukprot:XP_013757966.1 hypothetical protein AMSG_05247 [Thecamonas trahens ATCC 50062]
MQDAHVAFAGRTAHKIRSIAVVLKELALSALDDEKRANWALLRQVEKAADFTGPGLGLTSGSAPKAEKIGAIVGVAFADPHLHRWAAPEPHSSGGDDEFADDRGAGRSDGGAPGTRSAPRRHHWIVVVAEYRVFMLEYTSSVVHVLERVHLEKPVAAFAMLHACYQIVLGGTDGVIRVWDAAEERMVARLSGAHTKAVSHLVVASAQKPILMSAASGEVALWDLESETLLHLIPKVHSGSLLSLAVGTDPALMYSVGSDKKLAVYTDGDGGHVNLVSLPSKAPPVVALTPARSPRFGSASMLAIREKDSHLYVVRVDGAAALVSPILDLRRLLLDIAPGLKKKDKVRLVHCESHSLHSHEIIVATADAVLVVALDASSHDAPPTAIAGVAPFRALATATRSAYMLVDACLASLALSENMLRAGAYASAATATHLVPLATLPRSGVAKLALSPSEKYLAVLFADAREAVIYDTSSWAVVHRASAVLDLAWASGLDLDAFAVCLQAPQDARDAILADVAVAEKSTKREARWDVKLSSLVPPRHGEALAATVSVSVIDSAGQVSVTAASVALPAMPDHVASLSSATPASDSGLHPLAAHPAVVQLFSGPLLGIGFLRPERRLAPTVEPSAADGAPRYEWRLVRHLVFVDWSEHKVVGHPMELPRALVWDVCHGARVAVAYDSHLVVAEAGPSGVLESVCRAPFRLTSAVWFNNSLLFATASEIRVLFPSRLAASTWLLASYAVPPALAGSCGPGQGETALADQLRPAGAIALLGVVDDALLVLDTRNRVTPISLAAAALKFRLLSTAGEHAGALQWAQVIHASHCAELAAFLEARGAVASALAVPHLDLWSRFAICIRAGELASALECALERARAVGKVLLDVRTAAGAADDDPAHEAGHTSRVLAGVEPIQLPARAPLPLFGSPPRWAADDALDGESLARNVRDAVAHLVLVAELAGRAEPMALKVVVQAYSAAGELDPRAYLSLALFFWEASLVDLLRALLDQLRAKSLLDAAIFVAALLEDGEELRTSLVACDRLGEALAVTDGWRLGQRHVLAQVWERRRQSPAGPSINMSAGVADRVSRQ